MKKAMFDELLKSAKQGSAILKGKMLPSRYFNLDRPNVRIIRKRLGLSQSQFSRLMGIRIGTLRNWEQGRRHPEGPARVLLGVVAIHPEVLPDVIRAA